MGDLADSGAGGVIVWREMILQRASLVFSVGPVLVVCILVTVLNPLQPVSWILGAVLGVGLMGELRRKCTLDAESLAAQGRFARRCVALNDLRQVGMGIGYLWVQTKHPLDARGGTILSLRMIPTTAGSMTGQPSGMHAVSVIRARAVAAGATLDEPLTKPRHPPRNEKKPLIFSI